MKRLLFVDDEPNVISGLKRQLNKLLEDCEIAGANSAKEALELIEKTAFDTIILDIRMPGMDGIELLPLLKDNPKTRFIPVIMLTGCSERELKRKALDLGAYDFVNKPADPYELTARLKGSLRMKSYEDQLRNQNMILEQQLFQAQKMELIGLLASSVAHDLNNILSVIAGNTELAAHKARTLPSVQSDLDLVLKSCHHGASLVKQILWLGRGADSEYEVHDLRQIVDESLTLLSALIPKSVEVVWSKPDAPCMASIHETQMIQVLMNLITNAIHAMNDVGTLTIDIACGQYVPDAEELSEHLNPGLYHKISVSDTGSGMDQDTINRVFESFYTTKPKGKGAGIGLSVVNRIVKRLGGHVTVESAVGVGTTFHVYLPAVETTADVGNQEEGEASVEREKTNSVC